MKGCQTPAARLYWILLALFAALAGSAALVAAQGGRSTARSARSVRAYPSHAISFGQPILGVETPAVDTRRINPHDPNQLNGTVPGEPGGGERYLAGGPGNPQPSPSPPPYFDLTTFPRPPQVGDSTLSHDLHPFFSPDQQFIFIDSDRADINGTTVGQHFHIYMLSADGSQVSPITGTGAYPDEVNGDQIFPAENTAGTKLAYVHRAPGSTFQLYVLDLNTGVRTQLTNRAGQPVLLNAGKPSWSEGGDRIAFHAQDQNVAGAPFNIFTVSPTTLQIVNVTKIGPNSTAVEAVDPAFRRVGNSDRIAFASTGQSLTAGGGFNLASGTPGHHNIWEADPLGPTATNPFLRLTNSAAGDDREPAWNRGFALSRYVGALAFTSKGRFTPTYDICWTDSVPESPGSVHELLTPDDDPAVPAALRSKTDETSPSWSLGINGVERIAYHANRLRSRTASQDLQPSLSPNFPIPWDLASSTKANRDVWESDVADVNPPTLLPVDAQNGVILRIVDEQGRKIGVPGETFHFTAQVQDTGSGVGSVWVQIKDPDSSTQDAQGREHKLYGLNEFAARIHTVMNVQVPTHDILTNIEFDAEGIGVSDYTYYNGGQRNDFRNLQGVPFFNNSYGEYGTSIKVSVPSYLPGIDDAIAWSGKLYPPKLGKWLQLQPVAGQKDTYAGDWKVPDVPSDFYVDLIAYDKAVDPLNPANVGNWIIYDNVGGFSTAPLVEKGQALAVMDNALGQKWLRGANNAFRPFPAYRLGTESAVLDKPRALYSQQRIFAPTNCTPPVPPFFIRDIPDNTLITFQFGGLANPMNFVGGEEAIKTTPVTNPAQEMSLTDNIIGDIYPHYGADVWRTLAKGPVPPEVLADYLPRHEAQPDPTDLTGQKPPIDRLVPERLVLWHDPFAGDSWVGAGSLIFLDTQTNLTNFVKAGGRLIVDGGDVGWGLTQNGTDLNQPFFSTVLDAKFPGDSVGGETTAVAGNALASEIEHDTVGAGFNNRAVPPHAFGWQQNEMSQLITPFAFPPIPNAGNEGGRDILGLLADDVPSSGIEPAIFPAQNSLMDGVEPNSANTQPIYPERIIARRDPTSGAKVLLAGFGFQTMGRRYEAASDPACPSMNDPEAHRRPLITLNYKEKLGHTIFCWMLSASLTGQIKDVTGQTVSGALVTVKDAGGNIIGTALSPAMASMRSMVFRTASGALRRRLLASSASPSFRRRSRTPSSRRYSTSC